MEYILLLAIVIALFLSLGRPLGESLAQFSGALVGKNGYYDCLIKEGRLPGDPLASACGRLRRQAVEQAGRIGSGLDGDSAAGLSGGGAGREAEAGRAEEESASAGGDLEGSKRAGSYGAPERHKTARKAAAGASSSEPSSVFLAPEDFKGGFSKEAASKKKKIKASSRSEEELSAGFESSKKSARRKTKMRIESGGGFLGDRVYSKEEEEKKLEVFQAQGSKKAGGGAADGQTKQSLIADKRSTAALEDEDKKPLGFKGFLKYLLIAVVIIAAAIAVFSQIMEYQNQD